MAAGVRVQVFDFETTSKACALWGRFLQLCPFLPTYYWVKKLFSFGFVHNFFCFSSQFQLELIVLLSFSKNFIPNKSLSRDHAAMQLTQIVWSVTLITNHRNHFMQQLQIGEETYSGLIFVEKRL